MSFGSDGSSGVKRFGWLLAAAMLLPAGPATAQKQTPTPENSPQQTNTENNSGVTTPAAVPGSQTSTTPAAPPATSPAPPAEIPQSDTPQPTTDAGVTAPQGSGTRVHGTITDPDGDLIPGATVQLKPGAGAAMSVKTGQDGTYNIIVPAGSYAVLVTMPGFASYSASGVKIPATASMTLDAKLQIGVQSQVVNVQADAVQLSVDPDSNASSTVLSGKDLEALSDDPDELQSELQALAGPSAGPNGGQIYVDGFTGGQLPPKSSIREIRVNQNPFSAEYDKLGYGRIEIFTKPGTDKLHGNIQVNGNPSFFNSSNPLETGYQPPYHTLFIFGNLTGPLSKMASYNLGGTFRQIQDDEFTNATIPVVPGATTLCQPGTAGCTSTYQYQQQTYYPQRRADINPRLDLALGSKNVLTIRYQYVNNTSTDAGVGNLALPTAGYDTTSLSNIVQLSDTQTFSTRLINETRFEYEREHVNTTPLSTAPTLSLAGDFTAGGYAAQNLSDHQDHFEVQNYTSLQLKKNFIRFGGRLRTTREAQNTGENTNGQFVYTSLAAYQAGTPTQFSLTQVNNHDIGDTYDDLGLYAETDWKARQNLTISYGFRYETQNHIADHHDFAPRVSFNYGLFAKHGAPKTVLRGGFGIFYDRFQQANILNLEQENGTNETVYTVDAAPGATLLATCNPSVASQTTLINACGAAAAQTVYQMAPTLRTPYISQFAIGADQQVSKYGTISINYLHSLGVHELATQNINYNPTASLPMNSAQGPIYQYFTEGAFHQDQLIVNGRLQVSRRVSLFGFTSLNSAKGDTSGAGAFVTEPFNIKQDFGRTTFDIKSRYFLSGSITLPKFILLSPFIIGQSGNPFNITTGTDNNNDSVFNDRPYLAPGAPTNGSTVKSIAGCGTFADPGSQPTGSSIVPINYCTGPSLFTFNIRITKTIGFGGSRQTDNQRGGGQGGGGGRSPLGFGGGPGGGGARGGGGPRGGSGTNTGKRYNLAFGVQIQNLFNNEDLATPIGQLTSSKFGQSTQVTGGPYTTDSALRRISLNASFVF
jgi:hypothetical protein